MLKKNSALRTILQAIGIVKPIPAAGDSHKDQFQYAMRTAQTIAKKNPRALADFVRLLARPSIAERMAVCGLFNEHQNKNHFTLNNSMVEQYWFGTGRAVTETGKSFDNIMQQIHTTRDLYLGRDLVVPFPWHAERFVNNLATLGSVNENPWQQDNINHHITLWLPLGIAWVTGGNHSITAGIIQGEGKITAHDIYDISPIYEHVVCDGETFRTTHYNEVIAPVTSPEWAAIFEIGRIMLERGVSA